MNLEFLQQFDFFAGVPDSLLSPVCNYLINTYGIGENHIIAANEGNAVALAAGYHLATGKIPVVYLQNSGLGNIVNPVVSLMHERVYGIPCLFLVGWRGEPGVHDEPQHVFQGEVTMKLLESIGIQTMVITTETEAAEVQKQLKAWEEVFARGQQTAFVIKKGALACDEKFSFQNEHVMKREAIIRHIVDVANKDVIVSTTGKTSRELYEIREANGDDHANDFLTVGSMGHSSSIAMGIALQMPNKKIWIIDGDGAVLMHMGSMALLGSSELENVVHIVINNGAHESVGGIPSVADRIDLANIARGCGYPSVSQVDNDSHLVAALRAAKVRNDLSFIEVKASIGSRSDLGRPTTTAKRNKEIFMAKFNAQF